MVAGKVKEEDLVVGITKGLESLVVVAHVEDMEHEHVEGEDYNDGESH